MSEYTPITPEIVWNKFRSEYEASFNAKIYESERQAWEDFAKKCSFIVLSRTLRHFENRWTQDKDYGREPKRPSLAEVKNYYFVALKEYKAQKSNEEITGTHGSCQYCHNTGFAYAVRDDYSQKLLNASKPCVSATYRAFTDQVPCYCRIGQKEAENTTPPDWWKSCLFSGDSDDEAYNKAERFKEKLYENYHNKYIKPKTGRPYDTKPIEL